MVTSAGTNPVREIVTARSAAVADPSAVSAKTAATAMKSLRIMCSSCERSLVHRVMPRSNGKHLLIANSYTLLLISLRFAGPGDSAIGVRSPARSRRGRRGGASLVAYLTVIEEDEPEEVAVYCPTCAKREFEGDDG